MSDFQIAIEPEEIVKFLKSEIALKDVYHKILCQKVIHQAAQARGITVTEEEIQTQADRQRREKGLEKASDTLLWLSEQFVTSQDWEVGIYNHLLAQKLAERLFSLEAEKFFHQNSLDFEQVVLYQMLVAYEKLAQEIYYQIEESELSFYHAAYLYDMDDQRRRRCGYEGKVNRGAIQPEIAAFLFSTPPKQLIGPLKTNLGYHLFLVDELIPAELTQQNYQEILHNMFQKWLNMEVDRLLHSS